MPRRAPTASAASTRSHGTLAKSALLWRAMLRRAIPQRALLRRAIRWRGRHSCLGLHPSGDAGIDVARGRVRARGYLSETPSPPPTLLLLTTPPSTFPLPHPPSRSVCFVASAHTFDPSLGDVVATW